MANMKHLPQGLSNISLFFESFRERYRIGTILPEISSNIVQTGGACSTTHQQAVPRGNTIRLIAIGSVEADAPTDQRIYIRRNSRLVTVGSDCWFQIVDQNKKDIRLFLG